MANLKYYNSGTEEWETLVIGKQGPTGPQGVPGNDGALSPNAIINGAFEINQRNFTSTTSNGYGFDRWYGETFDGTVTYSSQAFTTGSAPVAGYEAKDFARIVTSGQTSSSAYAILMQRIEDVRTLSGQTATVSFWAKAGSGTPKIAVEIDQQFGTGGSPSSRVTTLAGQVTLSTSWARYSVTVEIPSLLGKTIGTNPNSSFTALDFWFSSGSTFNSRSGSLDIQSNTFDIWGVQLEAGTVATPFKRNAPSIQAELAACQRYYWRWVPGAVYGTIAVASAASSTSGDTLIVHPVRMRVPPTSIEALNMSTIRPGIAAYSVTALTLIHASVDSSLVNYTSSNSASQGQAILLSSNNTTNAFVGLGAEL
jgi:hypothetical protein